MSYTLIMTRTNEEGSLLMKKVYACCIPPHIIKQMLFIEKTEWRNYYDLPYRGLSGFILHHLSEYPKLSSYITTQTPAFDFTYEFLTDSSKHLSTSYTYSTRPISEEEYRSYAHQQYYFERWILLEPPHLQYLVVFECEYIPCPSI